MFAFEYLINITYHEQTSKHRNMFYAVIPDIFDFILTELLFHNRQFCSKDYYWVVAPTILHNKTEIKHKRHNA